MKVLEDAYGNGETIEQLTERKNVFVANRRKGARDID